MKINSLLFVIVALLPMGLMAQSDITLGATYLPYESTILIHVVNSANKSMRIRNSYGWRAFLFASLVRHHGIVHGDDSHHTGHRKNRRGDPALRQCNNSHGADSHAVCTGTTTIATEAGVGYYYP